MHNKIVLLLLSLMFLAGCYHDNEEELVPCRIQPGEVHYGTTITPLLNSYGCYSCHSGAAAQAGVRLDTYPSVKALAVSGRLVGAISHASGFTPMPMGGAKMDDCDINKIKVWVDAGAPEH